MSNSIATGNSPLPLRQQIRNYISNPDAETVTAPWATYVDASASIPVDGIGGSANITLTRTTSLPLRGTASFLITKDAANRQGQGISYDFSIDNADLAKPLLVSFDYTVSSGTYADGDMRVYLYDVTNSQIIEPAGTQILSVVTDLPQKHKATFQTNSNSNSYRLIIHVASTSASSYNLKLDNLYLGPHTITTGTAITDWKAYTLNITAATSNPTPGTIGTNAAYYRRIGDSLEIQYSFRQTTAGTNGSGIYFFSLPSGLSIDTTKINTTDNDRIGVVGSASGGDGGAGTSLEGIVRVVTLSGAERLVLEMSSETNVITRVSSSFSGLGTSGQRYSFRATVPIVGWSSNVEMSNDTDTRVVAARYYASASTANSSFADNTFEVMDFDTKVFDTHGAVTTGASWKYTLPISGIYRLSTVLKFTSAVNLGDNLLEVRKNSVNVSFSSIFNGQQGNTFSCLIQGVAGDILDVRALGNTSDSSPRIIDTASIFNSIDIERISGPSAIAASENVVAIYETDAGQNMAQGGITIVDYEDKIKDSHGAVTTGASWKFTAPVAGDYDINARATPTSTTGFNAGEILRFTIYKNGAILIQSPISYSGTPEETTFSLIVSGLIPLLAGEYIDVRVQQNSGAAVPLSATGITNRIQIRKV